MRAAAKQQALLTSILAEERQEDDDSGMQPLIMDDDAVIAQSSSVVGGKAATLARLRLAGIAVPEFAVATGAAFLLHLHSNAIGIIGLLSNDISSARPASITDMIRGASLPDNVDAAIQATYQGWNSPTGIPRVVAVRSSAVGEDGAEASFAGQFESFLGVRGVGTLLQRVKDCWAAYFNDRSATYRAARTGPAETTAMMGVIIQRQIFAAKAGVLFTQHPVTRDTSLIYIEANFGTGESVVGGLVIPDAITVSRAPLVVTDINVGLKSVMSTVSPTAPQSRVVSTPQELLNKPVLTEHQALAIAEIGLHLEQLLGGPQDIEWAIESDRIWILQARPVTHARAAGRAN